MAISIRRANEGDVTTIEALLDGAGVHSGGIVDNIARFLVVEEERDVDKRVVGTVGLEVYEERYGVMRSLVMQGDAWNARIGVELLRLFVAFAETQGIDELYLLTQSTAPDLFIHMGFSTAAPEEIPAAVAACQHFSAYRNEQVIPMRKTFKSTSYSHPPVDSVDK
ncbi:MAG: GNAT family N-acetyltransferase [Tumebacillaceae bacterium]